MYAICQRNEEKLNAIGDAFDIDKRYSSYDELLKDPDIDAVHINSPIPEHGPQSITALKAGKHVACTVPMATSIEDCKKIVALAKSTGKTYMMMETVVYAREYLFMKELLDTGKLGKLQFVQASHQQDMDGWPNYWPGLPPMWYATHCVGPVAGLIGKPAEYVSCFGSRYHSQGDDREIRQSPSRSKPRTSNSRTAMSAARIIRSLFDTARQYRESIDVYGSKAQWNGRSSSMNRSSCTRRNARKRKSRKPVQAPDYAKRLPRTFGRLPPKASTIWQENPSELHARCGPWRVTSASRA